MLNAKINSGKVQINRTKLNDYFYINIRNDKQYGIKVCEIADGEKVHSKLMTARFQKWVDGVREIHTVSINYDKNLEKTLTQFEIKAAVGYTVFGN